MPKKSHRHIVATAQQNPIEMLVENRVASAVVSLTETVLARALLGDDSLLTRSECGAALGIATKTLEAMAADGSGPKITRIGGAVRYRLKDVRAYLDNPAGPPRRRRKVAVTSEIHA